MAVFLYAIRMRTHTCCHCVRTIRLRIHTAVYHSAVLRSLSPQDSARKINAIVNHPQRHSRCLKFKRNHTTCCWRDDCQQKGVQMIILHGHNHRIHNFLFELASNITRCNSAQSWHSGFDC